MSHVAAHRLADLAAGRLHGRGAARAHVHLDGCERCRQAFDRIRQARSAFAEMAGATSPELRWDRIRAQVYWSLGQDRSDGLIAGPVRRPWLAIAGLGLAAAAAVAWAGPWRDRGGAAADGAWREVMAATTPAAPAVAPADVVAPATPRALAALVTLIEGDVTRTGATDLAAADEIGGRLVVAGDRFTTGDGRVALQLGPASTATLGAGSRLTVERLDAAMIALAVDGRVDVELEHRAPDQRFLIVTGDRTVEVRGTAFQVDHVGGTLSVACEHGRVAVTGGGATVEVGAGQGLTVGDGEALFAHRVRSLDDAELAALAASRPSALGLWTDAATMLATTAPIALIAPRGRAVRIDGEVVGAGPLWMRKPAGRHLIEAERATGDFGPGRWIVLDGQPRVPVNLAEDPAASGSASATGARKARKAELARRLDRGRLSGCVRALAKQDMAAGTFVELEIGVGPSGAIEFLNIAGTDLPDRVARCVRDVVADARLAAGPRATWRDRISF